MIEGGGGSVVGSRSMIEGPRSVIETRSVVDRSVVGGPTGSVVETRSIVRKSSRGDLGGGLGSPGGRGGGGLRGRMPLRGNVSPNPGMGGGRARSRSRPGSRAASPESGVGSGVGRTRSRANSITTTTTTTRRILPEGGLKVSFSQNRQVTRRPMGRPGYGGGSRGMGRPLGPPRNYDDRAMIPLSRPDRSSPREVVTRLGPMGVQDPLVRPSSGSDYGRPLSRGPMPPPSAMRRGPLQPPRGPPGSRYSKMTTTTTTTMTESGENSRPIL